MKRNILHTIILFFVVSLYSGCSTEKNTRVSRAYHNLTSEYNVYFNANESMKAGLQKIDQTIQDDYTHLLPIFKDSDPSSAKAANSDMENVILKASKLIKQHSITKKPKRKGNRTRRYVEFASKEEFNKWIDDSYLIMGKAYFYQDKFISAIDNFSYIIRKFSEGKTKYVAYLWLVRSYTEMERYVEASELIQTLQGDNNFPKKLERDLAIVTADYYMHTKEYAEAIKFIDIALQKTFWKKNKARLTYILAQLYKETGNNAMSAEAFERVSRLNAPYKMAFNARINAAGVYTGEGDVEKLKKELNKMLRDEKNIEFRDQIYYALGNLMYRQGNEESAYDNYRNSVKWSVSNNYQLAQSSITLGDMYFKNLKYREAQAYYDSAMAVIDANYPNYPDISARYNNLTQLTDNLILVEREDSLQRIAKMEESERNAFIDKLINEEKEKQRKADNMAMQGRSNSNYFRSNEYRFGLGSTQSSTSWYFYNPQTVSYGKVQFQQQWGRRKLEDDWRRSDKSTSSPEGFDELAEIADSTQKIVRIEDPLKREFYTQDLPLTDSLMAVSNEKIMDALYNAGKIFKSEFNDYQRSIESYEELLKRFPNTVYLLSSYFDLYDLYELTGDKTRSDEYRNLIISKFPDSKYAKYLINPNFFIDLETQKDSLNRLYQYTFNKYKAAKYPEVITLTGQMEALEPDSLILPKIEFLRSVALGTQSDMPGFETQLKNYIAKYPKAEPVPLAQEILTLIQDSTLADYQKLVEIGYLSDEIKNDELKTSNGQENDEFGGKFSYDEDLLHYFVIAYPKSASVDLNRLKFDIANYNIDNYTKFDFDIETENLDGKTAFLIVRALTNKQQALIYFRSLIRKSEVFQALKGFDFISFVTSSSNYRAILADKSLTDYLRFFVKNYSRFTGPEFKEEELDQSPEELMAKAEAEDDKLEEKGTFVLVSGLTPAGGFSTGTDTTQCFVLAVNGENVQLRQVMALFQNFNRDEFRIWNLQLQLKKAADYQLMVIKGIPGFNEGMSYFRRTVMNRALFAPLGQSSYRNFLATEQNLATLVEKGNVDEYMNFFRNNYLQAAAPAPATPTQTAPANQPQTEAPAPNQAQPQEYSGPYVAKLEMPHYFVFVVPLEGFNKTQFLENLASFNSKFSGQGLITEEIPLDNFRGIIRISKLKDKETAMNYSKQLVSNREIFAPLGNVNYRNFLISEENYPIFLKEKNITQYMDFYKRFYLGQQ